MNATRPSRWLAAALVAVATAASGADYRADFDQFCRFVADAYAGFDRKQTDWTAACTTMRPAAAAAADRAAFIGVLERALAEIHDAHAHLATSTPGSPRLVPTDTDLVARWAGDAATIVAVRAGSAAERAGMRLAMRVVEVDGQPVAVAIDGRMPRHLRAPDPAARDWALQGVLAGRQDGRPVQLVVEADGQRRAIGFVPHVKRTGPPVTSRRAGEIGVVTIGNVLGDTATIAAFDAALDRVADGRALVLDLRDTPSGGNSTVARGIMGRLVTREAAYQRHERPSEERVSGVRRVWVEHVAPRGRPFTGPVVVLVGHWTGSMAEGIAIGLHAARDATVVGEPMAGLFGGLDEVRLETSGIVVRIPAERLSHVDGTPREDFVPRPLAVEAVGDGDAELAAAVRLAGVLARR